MKFICIIATALLSATAYAQSGTGTQWPQSDFYYSVDLLDSSVTTYGEEVVEVNQGIEEFVVTFESIEPWICQAELANIYVDNQPLAGLGSVFEVRGNLNVRDLLVKYYAPYNDGHCTLIVRGYR